MNYLLKVGILLIRSGRRPFLNCKKLVIDLWLYCKKLVIHLWFKVLSIAGHYFHPFFGQHTNSALKKVEESVPRSTDASERRIRIIFFRFPANIINSPFYTIIIEWLFSSQCFMRLYQDSDKWAKSICKSYVVKWYVKSLSSNPILDS